MRLFSLALSCMYKENELSSYGSHLVLFSRMQNAGEQGL